MAVSDPIADLLTRIRNAGGAEHRFVSCQWSKLKEAVVSILKSEGFIKDYEIRKDGFRAEIVVFLKYTSQRKPLIRGLKRISKPGCRQYCNVSEIPYILGGMGIAILSTSKGVMTDKQARQSKAGGELLCSVW